MEDRNQSFKVNRAFSPPPASLQQQMTKKDYKSKSLNSFISFHRANLSIHDANTNLAELSSQESRSERWSSKQGEQVILHGERIETEDIPCT